MYDGLGIFNNPRKGAGETYSYLTSERKVSNSLAACPLDFT